jgi:hypothetical protein
VERQIEQRRCRVVDLVGVEGHREPLAAYPLHHRIRDVAGRGLRLRLTNLPYSPPDTLTDTGVSTDARRQAFLQARLT